jgi:hypothetical protein
MFSWILRGRPSRGGYGERKVMVTHKVQGIGKEPSINTGWPYERDNPWRVDPWKKTNPFIPMVPYDGPKWPEMVPRRFIDYQFPELAPTFIQGNISANLHTAYGKAMRLDHLGKTYLMAPPYAKDFTLRITNSSDCRVAVIVTVDGLSVMDGTSDDTNDVAYIIEKRSFVDIKGWRRGTEEVAKFSLVERDGSYADLVGKPTNVGIIRVTAYPEKIFKPLRPKYVYHNRGEASLNIEGTTTCDWAEQQVGTGYGEAIEDKVTSVSFNRDYSRKVELTYYYDNEEGLRRRGVDPHWTYAKPPATGNTQDIFCPPPLGGTW